MDPETNICGFTFLHARSRRQCTLSVSVLLKQVYTVSDVDGHCQLSADVGVQCQCFTDVGVHRL